MKRRWLRFSVRSLLVLITLCGLAIGGFTIFVRSHIHAYHLEQRALSEWNRLGLVGTAETAARGPVWLQKWKDGKYAQRVVNLSIQSQSFSETGLAKLRRFEYLQWLRIESNEAITDEALSRLSELHPTIAAAGNRSAFLVTWAPNAATNANCHSEFTSTQPSRSATDA